MLFFSLHIFKDARTHTGFFPIIRFPDDLQKHITDLTRFIQLLLYTVLGALF